MSLLRMTRGLSVTDYFAPFNEHVESRHDLDFGVWTGVMLLPETGGPHPREAVSADKRGWIFVVDRDHLGGFHRRSQQYRSAAPRRQPRRRPDVQQPGLFPRRRSSTRRPGKPLRRYAVSHGLLSQRPVSQSRDLFNYPGCDAGDLIERRRRRHRVDGRR